MVKPKDSMPGPQPEEPTAPKVSPKARAKHRKPASSKSKQRFYRLCPLGGCRLQHKPKQKLSQHIKVEHPEIDRDQRLELVRKAAIVRPDTIKYKQPPRQSSILMRTLNIMTRQSEITSPSPTPIILDFDWAGRDGIVRYPSHLNPKANWPLGANSFLPITSHLDKKMVEKL